MKQKRLTVYYAVHIPNDTLSIAFSLIPKETAVVSIVSVLKLPDQLNGVKVSWAFFSSAVFMIFVSCTII
jgi:hypothetical protein